MVIHSIGEFFRFPIDHSDSSVLVQTIMEDGLLYNNARCIIQDQEGHLWFGHGNAGLTYFDAETLQLNNVLKARTERLMNVTMAIGVIDAENKTLTIANAGVLPILLRLGLSRSEATYRNQGEIRLLKTGELPLGIKADIEYTEEQFPLQSGDVLILMNDGIIEAQDSEENYYSDSGRLEATISQFTQEQSAEAMVDAIIGDAIAFGGEKATRDDDMTVVVAKVL